MAAKSKATGKRGNSTEPHGKSDDGIQVPSAEIGEIIGPATENGGNAPSHALGYDQIEHNTPGELSALTPRPIKGRFVKGQSGNPGGRKHGQNHATKIAERIRLAEAMIEGQLESVIGSVVQKALDGDMVAAKILLDRIISSGEEQAGYVQRAKDEQCQ